MGHWSELAAILSTSRLPEPEGPGVAGVVSISLGGPLLEPMHLQQSLLHEGVGIHGPPGGLGVLGLEGDQPSGPVLEGTTQGAGQPQPLPVGHVPAHRGPGTLGSSFMKYRYANRALIVALLALAQPTR